MAIDRLSQLNLNSRVELTRDFITPTISTHLYSELAKNRELSNLDNIISAETEGKKAFEYGNYVTTGTKTSAGAMVIDR